MTPHSKLGGGAGISKNFQFDKFLEAGLKFDVNKNIEYNKNKTIIYFQIFRKKQVRIALLKILL